MMCLLFALTFLLALPIHVQSYEIHQPPTTSSIPSSSPRKSNRFFRLDSSSSSQKQTNFPITTNEIPEFTRNMDSTISERGGSDLSKTSIFTTRYPHNDDDNDGTTKSRFTTHSQIQLQVRTFATPPTIQKTFKFYIHENVRYDGDMKNCNSSLDPCFLMDHALAFVTSDVTQNLQQQQTGRIRIQFYLMTNLSSSYYCHNSLEESSGKFTYEIHVFAFEPLDQQRPQVHCQGAGLIKNSQQVVKLTFNNLTLYDTFIGMSFNSVSDDALIEINSCTLNGPGRQASVIISSRGANLRIVHSQLSSMNVASKEGIMVFEKSIISDSFLDFIDTTSIIFTACTLDRSTGIQSAGSSVHMEFCTLHHVPEFNVEKFSFVALHQCSLTNTRLLISFGNEFVIQFSNVTGSNNLFTVKGVVSVIIQHNNIYDTDVSPLETDSRAIFDMVLSDYVYVYQTNIIGSPRRAIYIDEANTIFFRESNFINNRGGIFINKLVRFTSGVERNVVRIWSCLFMNNTVSGGDGGAANIPKADVIHIYSSTFIDNTAANGGAIYLNQGSAEVDNCTFSNNVARLVTGVTIGKTGNGGAIYLKDMDYMNIGNTNFIQNRAIRGGAVYMLKEKDSGFNDIRFNLNCMDNTATYLGHCFYSEQSVPLFRYLNFTKIRGSQVGNYQVATSFISLTGWSFSKNATQTRESKLSLYPGQVISIYFGIVDYFGQNITNLQQQPILMVDDDVLSTVSFSRNNISIERLYFEIRDESVKHFNFSVAFPGTSMSVTFEVNVQDCQPGFILSTISASRLICQKDVAWPIIIPLIVVGSLLVFALGIFIGIGLLYCGWRIASRLRRLNQREKAEKKLEKKLLDKKFIFSEDHIELSSDLQTKLLDSYIDPTDSSGSGGKKDKKPQKKDTFIIPIDSIDVIKKIGEGANGIVYLGKWSGTDVALKSLKFDNSNDSNQDNEEFETEAALLSDLRHPSIVNFFGVAMSQSVKYMVVEFLSKGSLDKAIYNSKIGKEILSLETKISILKSVSSGMSYLHSLKPYAIIHRDLKPANILLDGAMNAKVSDFGLSKLVSTNATATMTTNLGTLFYMSPEILGDSDENSITTKLDVYSFAIIMYELFFEENPYLNIHSEKIHRFTSPDISDKSCFNIPAKVIKGLRPKIPFSNEEEQRVWISEYIRPREHYLNNDDLFELTSQYLHLMIQCWSGKSQHRPDFSSVTTTLSNMYNKFFD